MLNDALMLAVSGPDTNETPTCAHHWVLASPNGAVSHGYCRSCGARREFLNSTTDFVWEEERKSAVKAWSTEVRARSA